MQEINKIYWRGLKEVVDMLYFVFKSVRLIDERDYD
jgi:hypothetical protein